MKKVPASNIVLVYGVSIAVLLLLLLASLFFYRERMLFIDPCWVAFEIINQKQFIFSENRFGAFITQIFPLAGVYLGLSIKSILILYSLSFYLFYLLTALAVGLLWKQYELGILLALYFTLMVSDVFFWPNNEVHQGIAWMILFFGLYQYHSKSNKPLHPIGHFFLILFAVLALSCHLLVVIPFVFLWLYFHFDSTKSFKNFPKSFVLYSAFILFLIGLKYFLSSSTYYDSGKLSVLSDLRFKRVFEAFASGHSKTMLGLFATNYWMAILVFLAGSGALLKKKKWSQVFLLLLFSFGYYALVCIIFPDAFDRSLRFYMESEWLAFSLIVSVPFVYGFLPALKMRKLALALVLFIFLHRIVYLHDAYGLFNSRYEKLEHITFELKSKGIHKALFFENATDQKGLLMNWGLPVESIMLSKLEGFHPQVTFKIVPRDFSYLQSADSIYASFRPRPLSHFNKAYFQLDDKHPYQVLEDENLD